VDGSSSSSRRKKINDDVVWGVVLKGVIITNVAMQKGTVNQQGVLFQAVHHERKRRRG